MNEHKLIENPSLKEILEIDKKIKEGTQKLIEEEIVLRH